MRFKVMPWLYNTSEESLSTDVTLCDMPHCVRFSLAGVDVKVTKVSCFFSPVFRLCHLALISAPEGIKSNGAKLLWFFLCVCVFVVVFFFFFVKV